MISQPKTDLISNLYLIVSAVFELWFCSYTQRAVCNFICNSCSRLNLLPLIYWKGVKMYYCLTVQLFLKQNIRRANNLQISRNLRHYCKLLMSTSHILIIAGIIFANKMSLPPSPHSKAHYNFDLMELICSLFFFLIKLLIYSMHYNFSVTMDY